MKRWPLIVLISLAVIVFLSPGIVGHLAEKNLDENLSWLESENDDIVITSEQFDRGWFTSEGRHRVTLRSGSLLEVLTVAKNPGLGSIPSLVIDTRLDHGLVPVTSLGREQGSLMPSLASSVSTLKIDNGDGELIDLPGTIYSTLGLNGNATFHYVMDSGSQTDANTLMTWSGADITVATVPASRSFSVQGSIEPTTLESYGVITEVGPVTFAVTQDRSQYAFGIGKIKLEIDSVSVTSPGEPVAGFGKISLDAINELDGDRVSGRSTLQLDRVMMPGIGAMNVAIDFSANGIDADALQVLMNTLQGAEINSMSGDGLTGLPPQAETNIEQLMASGMEIHFTRFDVSVPQGDLSTSINLTVGETDPDDSFSWPSVILATTASVDLTLSTSLYEFVQTMVPEANTLIAMGVLKRNGDRYETEIRYAKGLLTINGAPMPIPLGMPR